MQKTDLRPRERFSKLVRKSKRIMEDAPEICSFTLEPCLLQSGALSSSGELCPFTLEQVCISKRASPVSWN